MDDGKVGGNCEDVVKDLLMIGEEAGYLGLKLNPRYSALICSDPTARGNVLSAFSGSQVVNKDDATLLGSPLGSHECVSRNICEKANVLKLMGDSMKHLHLHGSLILLLTHSLSPR